MRAQNLKMLVEIIPAGGTLSKSNTAIFVSVAGSVLMRPMSNFSFLTITGESEREAFLFQQHPIFKPELMVACSSSFS